MTGKEGAIMSDIAKNIKKLRQRKKLTQEELAEKLYVTRQAVSNWETGKNQPDIDTLKALAETLEVDVGELLYGPAPDQNRRKKIIVAVILCALAVAAWGAFVLVYDKAMFERHQYKIGWSIFLTLVLRPLALLITGAALPALISIWRDLRATSVRVRRWMLAVAAVFLLVYALGFVLARVSPKINYYWLLWGINYPWTFLLPGALFFCGSKRKAG